MQNTHTRTLHAHNKKKDTYKEREGERDMDFKNDATWADVIPIPQDDGPHPVVPISYPREFSEAMGYFRAVLQADELSERAVALTRHVISLNSGNYTAWCYLRKLVVELDMDIGAELEYCDELATESPKNYQIWQMRRELVTIADDIQDELEATERALGQDNKNYHVWSYRQWLLTKFKCYEDEFKFIHDLLEKDVRNNSAWNHRYFVVNHTTGYTAEVIAREIAYAEKALLEGPLNNDSPWRYLEGIWALVLRRAGETKSSENSSAAQSESQVGDTHELLMAVADKAMEKDEGCVNAHILVLELLSAASPLRNTRTATELCDHLCELDPVRTKYWQHRKSELPEEEEES